MNKLLSILCTLLFVASINISSKAQSTLPNIDTLTHNGVNILKWTNPYTSGVKAVLILRSTDSIRNFYTLGEVANINNPIQSFIDAHPLPRNNYYVVKVIFTSGTDWQSNVVSINVDSSAIANQKVLPPNDSLQKLVAQMNNNSSSVAKVDSLSFTRSRYVYTNPFNGNINIEVEEPFKNKYSLTFYTQDGKTEVLNIKRLNDSFIVLDKRNFQNTGIYKFKLLKNGDAFDEGFVTIY